MPDPKFNDKIVSKFTSCLMYDGKRSTAEKIVYGAFEFIHKKVALKMEIYIILKMIGGMKKEENLLQAGMEENIIVEKIK